MSSSTMSTLERLGSRIADEGGLLEQALLAAPRVAVDDPGLGALAAAGPVAAGDPDAFALVIEAAREGHLLHGGSSRLLDATDRDLAILAGDRLYALGLADLAALGAVDAVRDLADVIALSAQARAAQDPQLAEAAWAAGVVAIGWGSTPEWERATTAAGEGHDAAASALMTAADAARARTEVVER